MLFTKIRELREKRAKLASDANLILERAAKDAGRTLTEDESRTFDALHKEIGDLRVDVDRYERQLEIDAELSASRGRAGDDPAISRVASEDPKERMAQELRAFESFLRFGKGDMNEEERTILKPYERTVQLGREGRAQSATTGASGGYTVPTGFMAQLERALKWFGPMYSAARIVRTDQGNTLPWPTVNDTAQSGVLLAENAGVANQDVTFGVVNFAAYKFSSKQVLVPVELLQDSAFDIGTEVSSMLGERIGRVLNTYATTGTGSSQPKGIVPAAVLGKTAASATAITYGELVDVIHSIDPAYRLSPTFKIMSNDSVLAYVRKLSDSQNRPLWEPNIQLGQPDTLLGKPYVINPDMAAMTTGQKTMVVGDFNKFVIREVKDITVLRLVERYADAHQVGFLAFARYDSNLLDAGTNPVKYLIQA